MGWAAFRGFDLTREQMERRRLAAARDLRAGMRQADVARKYGVSEASVSRWARRLRDGGLEALRATKAEGPEPRLSDDALERLRAMLIEGAAAHGWSTDLWTTKRIATLIEREFGVRYHFNHVGKLLVRLGFTWRKPRRAAREKDEARKDAWLRSTWAVARKN